jgi:cardiolipin synthase
LSAHTKGELLMRSLLITASLLLGLLGGGCAALPYGAEPAPGLESALIPGNKVTLLFDGPQTMAAMEAAIQSAHFSIHLETYIFDQDPIGLHFAELLIAQQRAGVKTRIIYDSIGTLSTPDAFFDRLRASGIELLAFNPVNPLKLTGAWKPNHRDHRKILVVDGRTAFTGGVNISQSYSTSSLFRSKARKGSVVGWRDTHLQIEGPAVAVIQGVFLRTWNAHTEVPVPATPAAAPRLAAGSKTVQVVASEPGGRQEVYAVYIEAIHAARQRIYLTCAYFVPDAAMLQALLDAARRGVDVRLIVPGVPEGGIVFFAGHALFEDMLEGGMRIFQMREAVLHAKTAVIDGHWSTVGSTNMDTRSFLHNSEINVIVIDKSFGSAMESAFAEDLKDSDEVLLEDWRKRPLLDRLKEWGSQQFDYWL